MLGALLLAALTAPATGLATIHYDLPPPNFSIPTRHGNQYLSDLRGRVVIIDFWASWCHVCTEELKDFVRARETFGDKVAIVTISQELPNVAASYLQQWNLTLPLVEDVTGAISRIYSISKIPITLVLAPDGTVSYVSVGGLSWDELSQAVEHAGGFAASASTHGPGVLQ